MPNGGNFGVWVPEILVFLFDFLCVHCYVYIKKTSNIHEKYKQIQRFDTIYALLILSHYVKHTFFLFFFVGLLNYGSYRTSFYIGMDDIEREGTFEWLDGTLVRTRLSFYFTNYICTTNTNMGGGGRGLDTLPKFWQNFP